MDEVLDAVGDGRDYCCRWCHRTLWKVHGATRNWLASALTLHEQHCRGEQYSELQEEPVGLREKP